MRLYAWKLASIAAVSILTLALSRPVHGWVYDGGDIPTPPSRCVSNCGDGDGNYSSPPPPRRDYEAERRAQEAAAAERQRQQDETDRIARERVAAEKREKDEQQAKFIRERNAVVLKGSSGTNTPQLKGLSSTFDHGLKGSGTEAGAQLKTVERHGRETPLQDNELANKTARKGFDTSGMASGNLIYPDKDKYRQIPPSALEQQVPPEAMGDPQVKQMLDWYRSLDAQKVETTQKIATVKDQQKQGTGDAAVLSAQLGTLTNQIRQIKTDQTKATEAVKKQVKHLGFEWVESPEPTSTEAKSK
jgi:hypothetical protein